MNFWKSSFLLALGIIIGVSGTGIINFVSNNSFDSQEIPTIGSDTELMASLRRKVQDLDKLTCSERYKKYEDVYKILADNYYAGSGGVKLDMLLESGLHGFVAGLKDSHTVYFDKQENDDFAKDLKGSYDFEGIGAVIGQSSNEMVVLEIIKGGPAFLAGIKPQDTILKVDGKSVEGFSVRDVVNLVRGPKGSKVKLTLFTNKEQKIVEKEVVRDKITIPSVYSKSYVVNNKKVGYINIATIGEDTADKFKSSYNDMIATGAQGIIIDLRGNGGGILPVAADIASYFIPKGKIVTVTQYRSIPSETYYSKGFSKKQMPVVVLVDELSASASEILAAALQYQADAKLVGTTTFGKGTIQTLYTLSDNSSIKFTIGKWFTPDSINVDKVGIKPNVEIKFDPKLFESKQIDNQLEKAKEVISGMIK